MNIILLSGGSGKRLWPLSNDVRAKQFLRLLADEKGQNQSMLQRVYHQIRTAQPEANILVVTQASQMNELLRQLPEERDKKLLDVLLEPGKRDTYPAIALACSYLSFVQKLAQDDVVIVLPIDPYTGMKYFSVLSEMEEAVSNNLADIVLMGIKPTYPSAKYGYILPDETDFAEDENRITLGARIRKVHHFREKPSEQDAEELIRKGAFWNGGVFAFRIGYLMNILESRLKFSSYEELCEKYECLERTSFDYKVVEKALSLAMVEYDGPWKDIGTWRTLSDEMKDHTFGNVQMADGNENTYIVNELPIPIVASGLKSVIVAASPDGILVSDLNESVKIKPYAEKASRQCSTALGNLSPFSVWDHIRYEENSRFIVNRLILKAGQNEKYQLHKYRIEIWIVTDGKAVFILDGLQSEAHQGDVFRVSKGQKYVVKAITNCNILRVQLGGKADDPSEEETNQFD